MGLRFEDHDSAPHNLAIYVDDWASHPIFDGEIFSGPASRI